MQTMGLGPVPAAVLAGLSERSRACIERLSRYRRVGPDLTSSLPISRQGAVLVLLYEQSGQLRVLLTTRSKRLRAHPGETAFPGGRVEASDVDIIETAHREAYEEVAVPLDCPDVHDVCVLEPFFSSSRLFVTPVVALLSNPSVLDHLRPYEREVAKIFDHPLEAVLDPSLAEGEPLVPMSSEHWPFDAADTYHNMSDLVIPQLGSTLYRMHRFRSRASVVWGLTADIMIKTAEIAYGKPPIYERYAPTQARDFIAICRLLGVGQVQVGMGNAAAVPVAAS